MIKFGKQVCVLGGAGFVGGAVIPALTKAGYQVLVALRHPERYRELALVPNVELVKLEGMQHSDLTPLFESQSFIVNLLADQTNITESVDEADFVAATQAIKKAAETCGVQRLIQLSQIGANPTQAKSNWLRVLGESEAIVHNMASTLTTILRPGLLIGEGDNTTRLYKAQLERCSLMMVPNAEVQVQPLAVEDFASALVQCMKQKDCFNTKVDLVGEESMTIKELAEWVKDLMGLEKATVGAMCPLNTKIMLKLGWLAPFKTVTPYQQKQLSVDLTSMEGFATRFGFEPASIETILAAYVFPHRIRERYKFFRTQAGRKQQEFD